MYGEKRKKNYCFSIPSSWKARFLSNARRAVSDIRVKKKKKYAFYKRRVHVRGECETRCRPRIVAKYFPARLSRRTLLFFGVAFAGPGGVIEAWTDGTEVRRPPPPQARVGNVSVSLSHAAPGHRLWRFRPSSWVFFSFLVVFDNFRPVKTLFGPQRLRPLRRRVTRVRK